jgi:hypothetical protein
MNEQSHDSLHADDEADWLDGLLRATPSAPIADDGFTARVLQRVTDSPSVAQLREELQRRKRQDLRFDWFSLVGAALGAAIALGGSTWPSADEMVVAIQALTALKPAAAQVVTPWLASLCTAAVLAYVMSRED